MYLNCSNAPRSSAWLESLVTGPWSTVLQGGDHRALWPRHRGVVPKRVLVKLLTLPEGTLSKTMNMQIPKLLL